MATTKKRKVGELDGTEEQGRGKRKKIVQYNKSPFYIRAPSYTPLSTEAGGKKSTAILGPRVYGAYADSDSNANLPKMIKEARSKLPKENAFVAGHLLNAMFGGDGNDSKNLTILSSKGNSNHKKFDEPVKKALFQLSKVYELLSRNYVDVSALNYGIEVTVEVTGGAHGSDSPAKYITKKLKCSAKVQNPIALNKLKDVGGQALPDKVAKECSRLMSQVSGQVTKANSNSSIDNPIKT